MSDSKNTPPKIIIRNNGQDPLPPQPHTGRRILKIFLGIILIFILGLGGFLVIRASGLSDKIFVGEKSSFYNKITDFIGGNNGSIKLIGESVGQVNVLLLGIGGAGHDGAYLSDTMILAQIRPDLHKVSLTAIPRDYLADLGPLGQRKINAAFAEGYAKNKNYNEGGKAAIAAVQDISGLSIPYFAVVDFKGFQQAIDLIGGVDVTVDRTFTDYTYPDSNEGYLPAVTFKAGPEHMTGSRALIFARSRHAAGPEGSDFARSIRQQKVIHATKEKVTSLNLVSDAGTLNKLVSVLSDHLHTNLSLGEMFRAYNLTKDFASTDIISQSLDPKTGLICPEILESNGAYVLTYCPTKSKQDVKNFFTNSFDTANQSASIKGVVWLADSTKGQLFYKSVEKQLSASGLTVYQISYTGKVLPNSVVYQVNPMPEALSFIKSEIPATEASLAPPGVKISKDKVDLVLIIGQNYVPPAEEKN